MSFSCLKDGKKIYSFQYTPAQWLELRAQRSQLDLEMPCCGVPAILKTSSLGTQFFAHKSKQDQNCHASDGESAEHIFAKYLVSKALYEEKWQVETEKRGQTEDGKGWIADIYANRADISKGMVVEVQWSAQSYEQTVYRQSLYDQSNIRCVWLFRNGRQRKSTNALTGHYAQRTKALPVFTLTKAEDKSFRVHNIYIQPNDDEAPVAISMELKDFVKCLFSKGLEFIPKGDCSEYLSLTLMKNQCCYCKKDIVVVGRVNHYKLNYGQKIALLPDATGRCVSRDCRELINYVFRPIYNFGEVKLRKNKTKKEVYIANACIHCDSAMGSLIEDVYFENYEHIETGSLLVEKDFDHETGHWFLKRDRIDNVNYELSDELIKPDIPDEVKKRFNIRYQWMRDFDDVAKEHLTTLTQDIKVETDLDILNAKIEHYFPKKHKQKF